MLDMILCVSVTTPITQFSYHKMNREGETGFNFCVRVFFLNRLLQMK